MKIRKTLSILCAIAMLSSALPTASAVSTQAISENAGKVIPVQVVEDTKNGQVSRIIEVAIPQNATIEEENALIYSVAFGQDGATPFSANAETPYDISYEEDITLRWEEQRVGGGKPLGIDFNEIDELCIVFDIKSLDRSSTKINFQVRSVANPSSGSAWKTIAPHDEYPWKVVYHWSEYPIPGKGELDVYAKTNLGGIAELNYCMVMGIVN